MLPPVRIFYVDDSGVENRGWVVFGWVEFMLEDWAAVLRHRLAWRKDLHREKQIPASFHLHTAEFLANRGGGTSPSLDDAWNKGSRKYIRNKRIGVLEGGLRNLASCEPLRLGVAHRFTTARNTDFAAAKSEVYASLVQYLDERLAVEGESGILVMDGDGSDHSYVRGHRSLPLKTRNLLEDPLFQRSHSSQLIQMADLVAFSGYQSLLQDPEKKFAWSWYPEHLQAKDSSGGLLSF